jgi:hypothetical protein
MLLLLLDDDESISNSGVALSLVLLLDFFLA